MAWYSDDVIWNWGAARDARYALQRAADLLENTANERERKAREATAEWRGEYREDFDSKLRVILQKARSLANDYRNAASTIRSKSDAAAEEQRRRERARERARWGGRW